MLGVDLVDWVMAVFKESNRLKGAHCDPRARVGDKRAIAPRDVISTLASRAFSAANAWRASSTSRREGGHGVENAKHIAMKAPYRFRSG